jgi:hypothetical protein
MPPVSTRAARNARIVSAHAAGATIPQIAASLELDPALVARVIRDAARTSTRAPAPNPPAPPLVDPASPADRLSDPAWLTEAYATRSARAIAGELGVPVHRVHAALRAAGIPRRAGRQPSTEAQRARLWPADLADRALELYLAGESGPAVAKALGVPVSRVYELLRERGVMRSSHEARRLAEQRRREKRPGGG